MRLLCTVATIALFAALSAAAEPPRSAVLLPAHPLVGGRTATLALYLLENGQLSAHLPSLRAARGTIEGAVVATADGAAQFSYRPPHVSAPSSDVLFVTPLHASHSLRVPIEIQPTGSVRLAIEVSPSPLILGHGAHATVRIQVRDVAGRPTRASLRLGASIGSVSRPVEVGPGEYRALYTPPRQHFPQVAIVAALSVADGAHAEAVARLSARVTVTGQGEPGGTMRIAVDDRSFGPQPIGADGHFSLPIVVPPGGRAIGTSTDRLGNVASRAIDLHLPAFPRQLLLAVPSELLADGQARAEVVLYQIDARGAPRRHASPHLTASAGHLSRPESRGDGSTAFTLTAPFTLGTGEVILRGAATTRIRLRPRPPLRVAVVPPAEPLLAGDKEPQTVDLTVQDRSGSPVAGVRLVATLEGGRVLGIEDRGAGRYRVRLLAPRDESRSSAILHVEVVGLEPGPARRITLHPARAPLGKLAAEAWVDDDLGQPAPNVSVILRAPGVERHLQTDRYGTARIEFLRPSKARFSVEAEALPLPALPATLDYLVVDGVVHTVPSVRGRGVDEPHAPPAASSIEASLALRPALAVDLRLTVAPRRSGQPLEIEVRALDPAGHPLDLPLLYQAEAGQLEPEGPMANGLARLRFVAPKGAAPGARYVVSATDPQSGVTVFASVAP